MFEIYKDHSQKCSDEYVNMRKYELYKQQMETQQRLKQHNLLRDQHHSHQMPQPSLVTSSTLTYPQIQQQQQQHHHQQQQLQHQQQSYQPFSNINNSVDLSKKLVTKTKSNNLLQPTTYNQPQYQQQYQQHQVYNDSGFVQQNQQQYQPSSHLYNQNYQQNIKVEPFNQQNLKVEQFSQQQYQQSYPQGFYEQPRSVVSQPIHHQQVYSPQNDIIILDEPEKLPEPPSVNLNTKPLDVPGTAFVPTISNQSTTLFNNCSSSNNNSNNMSLLSQISLITSMQQYETTINTKISFDELISHLDDDLLYSDTSSYSNSCSLSTNQMKFNSIEQIENDLKMYCVQNRFI